jgi:hypothetical protein
MMHSNSAPRAGQALSADDSQCAGPLIGGAVFHVPGEGFSLSWTADRAQVAALIKHHPDDPSIADEGRRRLKVAKARRLIRALTSESPVLTIEQRAGLAAQLLAPGGGDADAAA